jgi:selenocysteine-specific elongation factor
VRHLVVGTAGHIDHGKSALVFALTGVHPDRLAEEQRRGITIDLGFADLNVAPEGVLSFVDVPGHERFVRHMVAGVSGLDAVLLVVAADDGIKPQTREHLAICSLLGVRHGLVVISKADLVEPELRDVLALELRELLDGTFLASAPILAVSSRTGEGLDALREAMRRWLRELPERPAEGVARLPIDRSFVQKGFGTVVTGTLVAGTLHEGEEIEILPGARRGRVRGLQVHKHQVGEVRAGRRVAVNIQGLDCPDAPRGATLTAPSALLATRRARVRIELLPGAPPLLRKGGPVRFHQGTCERAARLRAASPGAEGSFEADLVFAQDTVLLPGDRFILRRPAPVDTIGGGVVIDAHPPRGRPRRARGRGRPPDHRRRDRAREIAPGSGGCRRAVLSEWANGPRRRSPVFRRRVARPPRVGPFDAESVSCPRAVEARDASRGVARRLRAGDASRGVPGADPGARRRRTRAGRRRSRGNGRTPGGALA